MTTTEELTQDELAQAEIEGILKAYCDKRAEAKRVTGVKDQLGGLIKAWLRSHDVADVVDDAGRRAFIRTSVGTPTYDLVTAAQQHPEALIEAAKAGMLTLSHEQLRLFRDKAGATWADALARYSMPGRAVDALIVEEK